MYEEVERVYRYQPTKFSLLIHHGRSFRKFPNREYREGKTDMFDFVDMDCFSIHELDVMVLQLGSDGINEHMYYYYLRSMSDLDIRTTIEEYHEDMGVEATSCHLKADNVLLNEDLKGTRTEHGFKWAFISLFGQDVETFTSTTFLYLDQLENQLLKEHVIRDSTAKGLTKDRCRRKRVRLIWVKHWMLVWCGTEPEKHDTSSRSGNDTYVEDADSGKGFCKCNIENELRKLKGNSVDTKFAKPSILGKPALQLLRNHSVVRQPNAFQSERPKFSKPRFASQVDVKNNLPKPVTPHYLPKVRESVLGKPHYVIAPGSSRKSQEESYCSNDMAHKYFIVEARKTTQERNRNLKPREMPSVRTHHTLNACKPKPRRNNQTSRNWLHLRVVR
ncbi:hypothetical protein Tco_1134779 [Tanacetum coccineum]